MITKKHFEKWASIEDAKNVWTTPEQDCAEELLKMYNNAPHAQKMAAAFINLQR